MSTSAAPCHLFPTHFTSSETCSASAAPSSMTQSPLQKFSSWPRHLREDIHFWEEGSKINLLWICVYVLPSLDSGQLCLCSFICTHTGATNKYHRMPQNTLSWKGPTGIFESNSSANGRMGIGPTALVILAPSSNQLSYKISLTSPETG